MSIKVEANGRRSMELSFDVEATPEQVWQAIATGEGVSSWLMPAELEMHDGKPLALKMSFGPGMSATCPDVNVAKSAAVQPLADPPVGGRTNGPTGSSWAVTSPFPDHSIVRKSPSKPLAYVFCGCGSDVRANTGGVMSVKSEKENAWTVGLYPAACSAPTT